MHHGGADTLLLAVEGGLGGQGHALAAHGKCLDDQLLSLNIGIELGGGDVIHGHALQPGGLPDARGAGVGAAVGVVEHGLLTAGLVAGAEVVGDTHGDGVLPLLQSLGDIKGEGHVAADVAAHVLSVDPHLGEVIAGTDMEQDALTCPGLGEGQGLAVPHALAEILVTDARQLALAAEGDRDGLGEGGAVLVAALFAGQASVGLVLPGAVEVEPIGVAAVKLRAGKFGAGCVGCIEHGDIPRFTNFSPFIIQSAVGFVKGYPQDLAGSFLQKLQKTLANCTETWYNIMVHLFVGGRPDLEGQTTVTT